MSKVVNALYKLGDVWDRYNVFEGAKKTSTSPVSKEELITRTFCPGPTIIYIYDYVTQDFDYVSPSYRDILGYKDLPRNWKMKDWMELFPPEDYNKIYNKELTSLSFAQKHFKLEDIYNYKLVYTLSFRHEKGHYVKFLHQGFPLATNAFGQITKLMLIHTDMTGFDYYNDEDISFISITEDHQSYYSINNWKEHAKGLSEDYELTPRQLEIVQMIAAGDSNKEIAQKLDVSLETIKTHRRDLLRKTGKNTFYELISDVIDRGLLE